MKRLIWLLLISTGFAQTLSTLNGTTVGTSAGNISGWNGTTIGTSAGNIGAWNGLTSPGGGGDTTFVTGQTPGTARNNLAGAVGFFFTPGSAITVTQLCRWKITGNSSTHQMYLVDYTAATVVDSTLTLNLSTGTAGTYVCGTLGTPRTLTSGHQYVVASEEASGGDQWSNCSAITHTAAATVADGAYHLDPVLPDFTTGGCGVDQSFGPVNFKYH